MRGSSLLVPIAKRVEDKVAVMTGAASGIGPLQGCLSDMTPRSSLLLEIRGSFDPNLLDIQDDLGRSLCEDIIGCENAISFVQCDVSCNSDVQNVLTAAVAKHGKLDIMSNNAGITGLIDARILAANYGDLKKVFDVNVLGAFLGNKHAARVMILAKKGSILFTSSVISVTCGDVSHLYSASKHAVVGLTKILCVELGKFGIRVDCISPFGVATPMLRNGPGIMEKRKAEEFVSQTANLMSRGSNQIKQ